MPAQNLSTRNARPRRRRPRAKHTVLWVDDDPNLTASVARWLRRESIRLIPASDGMQGYWLALTKRPDAIITDLRMPRWEGKDLLECLSSNAETARVPTIVLSGYTADADIGRLAGLGAEAVLQKPVDLPVLLRVLRRVLD